MIEIKNINHLDLGSKEEKSQHFKKILSLILHNKQQKIFYHDQWNINKRNYKTINMKTCSLT